MVNDTVPFFCTRTDKFETFVCLLSFFLFLFYKNENTGEPSSKTGVFEFERIHEGDFKKKYEMSNKEPLHEL